MNYLLLRDRLYVWWTRNFGRIKCVFLGHDTATRYSANGRARARVVFVGLPGHTGSLIRCYRCWSAVKEVAESAPTESKGKFKREETSTSYQYDRDGRGYYDDKGNYTDLGCRPTPYIGWRPGDPE